LLNFETNIERDVSFISIFCINHRSIIQPFYTISNFYRITTTTLNTQNSTLSDKFAVTIETRRLTCFVGEERDKMELNSTENLRHDWELFQGWAIIAHCCSSRAITTTVIAWSMKPKRSFNQKKKQFLATEDYLNYAHQTPQTSPEFSCHKESALIFT
jgi:hypothetical protein